MNLDGLRTRVRLGTIEPMHAQVYRWVGSPRCRAVGDGNDPVRRTDIGRFGRSLGAVSGGCPGSRRPRWRSRNLPGRSQREPYGWVHGSLVLPPEHLCFQGPIRLTTASRTLFDLAGLVHRERVERALDLPLNRNVCSISQVDVVFGQLARRGRRGTVVMRELLAARTDGFIAPSGEVGEPRRALSSAKPACRSHRSRSISAMPSVGSVESTCCSVMPCSSSSSTAAVTTSRSRTVPPIDIGTTASWLKAFGCCATLVGSRRTARRHSSPISGELVPGRAA